MSDLLRLRSVTKRLGRRPVIDGMSLDVPKGRILGILGPSGCGKTTLLRLIAGLEVPDAGDIWFGDRLASSAGRIHLRPSERNIGFVFQDLALWPHMTVAGHLLFVLESRKWPTAGRKARVDELLQMVGLADRAAERPSHLSGGEQQRVALARALVSNPDVLLLDEPLSSLDSELRVEIRAVISGIVSRLGVTMIYVTHDRADADALGGERLTLL